jgi:signal transduction histidine kinase
MGGVNTSTIPAPSNNLNQGEQDGSSMVLCQQLRALLARSNVVLERERLLIARRLHDNFAQNLTVASTELSLLERSLGENNTAGLSLEEVRKRIKTVSNLLKFLIKSTCKLSVELRPKILEELGLAATLQRQLQEFESHTEIDCQLSAEPEEIRLDLHRSTEVFRIAQELLLNVARHAHASMVHVRLAHADGWFSLQVQDNGCGISGDDLASPGSLGLAGIRERTRMLHGEFKIDGIPGDGTVATVRFPTS